MKTTLTIREAWQDYYKRDFFRLLFIFLVTGIGSYLLFRSFVKSEQVDDILHQLGEAFEANGLSFGLSAWETMVVLFFNNVRVTFLAFVLGMIPLFIPYLFVIINAAIIGLVAMLVEFTGESVLEVMVLGILPHGITEISAILLGAAMGLSLNRHLWKKLRGKPTDVSFKALLLTGMKTFLLIALPLLAVSAIIEAYVTPLLLQ